MSRFSALHTFCSLHACDPSIDQRHVPFLKRGDQHMRMHLQMYIVVDSVLLHERETKEWHAPGVAVRTLRFLGRKGTRLAALHPSTSRARSRLARIACVTNTHSRTTMTQQLK